MGGSTTSLGRHIQTLDRFFNNYIQQSHPPVTSSKSYRPKHRRQASRRHRHSKGPDVAPLVHKSVQAEPATRRSDDSELDGILEDLELLEFNRRRNLALRFLSKWVSRWYESEWRKIAHTAPDRQNGVRGKSIPECHFDFDDLISAPFSPCRMPPRRHRALSDSLDRVFDVLLDEIEQ
jgi:hypothetical protein